MSARNIAITNYNIDIATPDAKNREKKNEKEEQEKLSSARETENEWEKTWKIITSLSSRSFAKCMCVCVVYALTLDKMRNWQGAGVELYKNANSCQSASATLITRHGHIKIGNNI